MDFEIFITISEELGFNLNSGLINKIYSTIVKWGAIAVAVAVGGKKAKKASRNHLTLKSARGANVYLIKESLLIASLIRVINYVNKRNKQKQSTIEILIQGELKLVNAYKIPALADVNPDDTSAIRTYKTLFNFRILVVVLKKDATKQDITDVLTFVKTTKIAYKEIWLYRDRLDLKVFL